MLKVFTPVVVMLEMLMEELDVSDGCFPLSAVAISPTPVRVMLLDALSVDAATDATLRALLVVNAACFPERADDILPTPARESDP